VSSIPDLTATTLGGIAAGLAAGYGLCGACLWRTRRALRAARLAALPVPTRLAARLSGDEFALLIDDHTGDALVAAHQAWRAIADTPARLPDGKPVTLTASVGVAVCRVGVDPRLLLHHADLAMYAAKRDQGGVRLFTPEPHAGPEHLAARPGVRPRDRWQRQASEPSTADSYLPHHPR